MLLPSPSLLRASPEPAVSGLTPLLARLAPFQVLIALSTCCVNPGAALVSAFADTLSDSVAHPSDGVCMAVYVYALSLIFCHFYFCSICFVYYSELLYPFGSFCAIHLLSARTFN